MRFITAERIFNGTHFLPDHSVLVLEKDNSLKEIILRATIPDDQLEEHEGMICPGFINSHAHLELSYLRSKINVHTGFTGFANELMAQRNQYSHELIVEAMQKAEKEMWDNGIVAVGDISNSSDSFELKDKSKIRFHTFIELIGLNPEKKEKILENGKALQQKIKNHTSSLSPHAPYTASAELLEDLAKEGKLALSIHNQESAAENEFFLTGTGKVKELYMKLQMDISWYQPSGKSSLQSFLPHLASGRNLILVHNTFAQEQDLLFAEALSKKNFWCFCPNANLYIENTLPDATIFLKNQCKIVIGTDSLASNKNLSMIDEINVLLQKYCYLPEEVPLRWATYNGALALGIEDSFGSLIKGKNSGLNLIDLKNRQFSYIKKLA